MPAVIAFSDQNQILRLDSTRKEYDPLEMILTANEKKLKQPILEADPLEEVLSIHESTAKGQETSI